MKNIFKVIWGAILVGLYWIIGFPFLIIGFIGSCFASVLIYVEQISGVCLEYLKYYLKHTGENIIYEVTNVNK